MDIRRRQPKPSCAAASQGGDSRRRHHHHYRKSLRLSASAVDHREATSPKASDALPLPLYLTNAVFFTLFFSVAYYLLHRWRDKIRSSVPLHVVTLPESPQSSPSSPPSSTSSASSASASSSPSSPVPLTTRGTSSTTRGTAEDDREVTEGPASRRVRLLLDSGAVLRNPSWVRADYQMRTKRVSLKIKKYHSCRSGENADCDDEP